MIRQEAEAEDLGIERQRPVLIGHRNADELDALDHARIVGATGRALQEGRFNNYYSDMYHIAVDDEVVDVLLPDLAGHDRSPSAFLVDLRLWTRLFRSQDRTVEVSLQALSAETGLSKSAVQAVDIRLLRNCSLLDVTGDVAESAFSDYELVRHRLLRRAPKR